MLGTAALFDEGNRYGGDSSDRLEAGCNEGEDVLRERMKALLNDAFQ